MRNIDTNQPVYLQVADAVKTYPYGVGRAAIADRFCVSKSTAQQHLEKCVRLGLLRKFYGWLSKNYRGWVYIDPDVAPAPIFSEVLDDPAWEDEKFQDEVVAAEAYRTRTEDDASQDRIDAALWALRIDPDNDPDSPLQDVLPF